MLDIKVFEKKNTAASFYILGYLLEVIIRIWRFGFYFFLQDLANLSRFFFHGKSFVWVETIIFQVEIWRNFRQNFALKFPPPQEKETTGVERV
jgi:hypothetical protein